MKPTTDDRKDRAPDAQRALQRAAGRAREGARSSDGKLVIWQDGRIVSKDVGQVGEPASDLPANRNA